MSADWTFPDDGEDYDLGLSVEQLKAIITVFKGRRPDITDVLVAVLNRGRVT